MERDKWMISKFIRYIYPSKQQKKKRKKQNKKTETTTSTTENY